MRVRVFIDKHFAFCMHIMNDGTVSQVLHAHGHLDFTWSFLVMHVLDVGCVLGCILEIDKFLAGHLDQTLNFLTSTHIIELIL